MSAPPPKGIRGKPRSRGKNRGGPGRHTGDRDRKKNVGWLLEMKLLERTFMHRMHRNRVAPEIEPAFGLDARVLSRKEWHV
jgi:hypothetical protein